MPFSFRFGRTLFIISLANAVLLSAVFIIQLFAPERVWPLAFLSFAPQQILLVPALALFVIACSRKQKKIAACNLLVLALAVVAFLDFSIARPRSTPASNLRVMSYNIRYGSGGTHAITAAIKAEKPDVVCLQEVIAKDDWPDPLPALRKALPEYSVARYGQLVTLSRFPIAQSRSHSLPQRNGCGILETHLLAAGKTIRIYNAHFINPVDGKVRDWPRQIQKRATIRQDQLALLAHLTRKQSSPYFIAGDFNTPPRGRLNRALSRLGTDAFAASATGFGYTFPAFCPVMRIDRIFSSPGIRPLRSRVLQAHASDHRALTADFVIR